MGHENHELIGRGRTRAEAERSALDEFFHEYGNRYSVSKRLKVVRLPDEPPMHNVEKKQGKYVVISSEPWLDAPKSEWLQVWEFTYDFHV